MNSLNQLSKNGFTLVEVIISVALLSIISLTLVQGVRTWSNILTKQDEVSFENSFYFEWIHAFGNQPTFMQINYAKKSWSTTLPMRWNKDGATQSLDSCKVEDDTTACYPGAYGVMVEPIDDHPELYKISLKITHKNWNENKTFSSIIGN